MSDDINWPAFAKELSARLQDTQAERDEYHEMLRSILALCDDSTRASLGPDAPLRAVRKAITERDSARAEVERMRSVYEAARRWCSRPEGVLREGASVLANDAEMWRKLRGAIDSATKGGS